MPAEEGGGKANLPEEWQKSLPSWRRIGEFIRDILRLERSVEALKRDNAELKQQIGTLQRQLDQQTGQLGVLLDFVNKALDEHVASRAEDAAIRALERMLGPTELPPRKKSGRKEKT